MSPNVTANIELEIVFQIILYFFSEHHKGPITLNDNQGHKLKACLLYTFSLMCPTVYHTESLSHC